MSLLKHLLFWPVTGPTFLTRFALDKVQTSVRTELTDDTPIKEDLLNLQMRLELGEIDDEEYVREETVLMARLREVRQWREEFGMGIQGGPVRVASVARGSSRSAENPARAGEPGTLEGDPGDPADGSRNAASPDGAEVELHFDDDT